MSTPPLRTRLAGLTLALGLLAMAACGVTSDDLAGDADTTAPEAPATTGGAESATTPSTPDPSTPSPPSTPATPTEPQGDEAAFCDDGEGLLALLTRIDTERESGDLEAFQDSYGEAVDQLEQMADEAPDEVADESEAVAGAFGDLEDDVAAAQSIADIRDLRDAPELVAVAGELADFGRYLQRTCGLDIDL